MDTKEHELKAEGGARKAELSTPLLAILRHAIGYDEAGNDRYGGAPVDARRNHFVTHPDADDWGKCQQLVTAGLMESRGPQKAFGGDYLFWVTSAGREAVFRHRPVPKKLTPGQVRYREWLRSDIGMQFGTWLKWRAQRRKQERLA